MTRRDEDQDAGGLGRAAERRRQFEQERGLSDRPRELQVDQEEAAERGTGASAPLEEDQPPTAEKG